MQRMFTRMPSREYPKTWICAAHLYIVRWAIELVLPVMYGLLGVRPVRSDSHRESTRRGNESRRWVR